MRFIELTGQTLEKIIDDQEIHAQDLASLNITADTIVRVNEQGDVEVRRTDCWDVIGGLLGEFEERLRRHTGLDWV